MSSKDAYAERWERLRPGFEHARTRLLGILATMSFDDLSEQMRERYVRGGIEHGGDIIGYSLARLDSETTEELIDAIHYQAESMLRGMTRNVWEVQD